MNVEAAAQPCPMACSGHCPYRCPAPLRPAVIDLMRASLGPCTKCGAPAMRRLGTEALCGRCAEMILAPIRDHLGELDGLEAEHHDGAGWPGPQRPDLGPGLHELTCGACGATWCGPPGDPCPYCAHRAQVIADDQRRLLLYGELPERDDARRPAAVEAWSERLQRAVDVKIITVAEAERAWARETGRDVGRTHAA